MIAAIVGLCFAAALLALGIYNSPDAKMRRKGYRYGPFFRDERGSWARVVYRDGERIGEEDANGGFRI